MELIKRLENANELEYARIVYDYFIEVADNPLESFDDWIRRQLTDSCSELNHDFQLFAFDSLGNPIDHSGLLKDVRIAKTDFLLTLECAKEISMMQQGKRGDAVRKYFIDISNQVEEVEEIEEIYKDNDEITTEDIQAIVFKDKKADEDNLKPGDSFGAN